MKSIVAGLIFFVFLAYLPKSSHAQGNPLRTASAKAAYGDNAPGKHNPRKKKKKTKRRRERDAANARKKTLKRSSMGYPARLD
jgi:hypothetical protein